MNPIITVERERSRSPFAAEHKFCDNCGEAGHICRDCPMPPVCFWCKQPGHSKATCPKRALMPPGPATGSKSWGRVYAEEKTCDNCGAVDHICRDCPMPPVCFWCKEPGHSKATCPKRVLMPRGPATGGKSWGKGYSEEKVCDNCGDAGHICRDCPMPPVCFWCKEPGHNKQTCPVRQVKNTPGYIKTVVATPGHTTTITAAKPPVNAPAAGQQMVTVPLADLLSIPGASERLGLGGASLRGAIPSAGPATAVSTGPGVVIPGCFKNLNAKGKACGKGKAGDRTCWNFVKTGTCARGEACAWQH
mmetsp:Transcript_88248/g.248431  ORF Transcript_88248/g.248431 Transcript_88248/m.248431 type:complete len:304 (+) Transcript_88248:93-1004(+)